MRRALVRAGAFAACAGGLALTMKAVVIIAGGRQPPVLFEAATPFLALGLLALAASAAAPSRASRVGGGLAILAGCLSGVAALLFVGGGDTRIAGAFLGAGTLLLLASALTLGWTMRREAPIRRPATAAFALGAATVPLVLVFGALAEAFGEAMLEGSILLLGGGWTAFGLLLGMATRHA